MFSRSAYIGSQGGFIFLELTPLRSKCETFLFVCTVCPRSCYPFYIITLLYKLGHNFLDIQYVTDEIPLYRTSWDWPLVPVPLCTLLVVQLYLYILDGNMLRTHERKYVFGAKIQLVVALGFSIKCLKWIKYQRLGLTCALFLGYYMYIHVI